MDKSKNNQALQKCVQKFQFAKAKKGRFQELTWSTMRNKLIENKGLLVDEFFVEAFMPTKKQNVMQIVIFHANVLFHI